MMNLTYTISCDSLYFFLIISALYVWHNLITLFCLIKFIAICHSTVKSVRPIGAVIRKTVILAKDRKTTYVMRFSAYYT